MYEILNNLIQRTGIDSGLPYWIILAGAIVIGLLLLTKGGDALSDHSSNLAKGLGVPSVVVGLTIVSIATSAPELFTSVAAIRSNAEGLILGNIIGSNIANIGLILGLTLMLKPIDTRNTISKRQNTILFLLTVSFCVFLFLTPSQSISFVPGMILLGFIFIYLLNTTFLALKQRKNEEEKKITNEKVDHKSKGHFLSAFFILLATVALWAGSDFLVFGAKNLATIAGVPEELIGFSILAIGTSLPELAASISLVKKGEYQMLLGNVVGSNVFNIALVGGVAGVLGPISSQTPFPWVDYVSLLLLTALFCSWMKGRTLKRVEGFFLLACYLSSTLLTWVVNG